MKQFHNTVPTYLPNDIYAFAAKVKSTVLPDTAIIDKLLKTTSKKSNQFLILIGKKFLIIEYNSFTKPLSCDDY